MTIEELQRLLAERDAEVSKWKALAESMQSIAEIAQSSHERMERLRALESQQAASVGGEREVCDTCHGQGEIYSGEDQHFGYFSPPEPIMITCPECSGETVAALSPAGGGVVLPERRREYYGNNVGFGPYGNGWNACLDEFARLNAKPQANSQWLAPEDELNVALVLSHAQDLREQGHTERADALVQAAEEYVAILAQVQAAQDGIRARAGEL